MNGVNSVLEINLDAIKCNVVETKKKLVDGQKLCAVVKADAYGLGAKKISKFLDEFVDYFAVSSASEFFDIKKHVTKPILILDPIYDKATILKLILNDAELMVSNMIEFELIKNIVIKTKLYARVHLCLNTGMNRFGFKDDDSINKVIDEIQKTQKISICGVFSHYFEANNENFAKMQFELFEKFKNKITLKLNKIPIFHISNSDGVIFKNGFDMARVGIALWNDKSYQTITLKSKIVEFQNLKKGETAGYSACFVATKKTKLAVVSFGYADGIFRNISGRGYVLVNGKFAKIVAVCMDSILIDVTNVDAEIFDDVILIGKSGKFQIFVCDVASWCDTISYEILTKISKRVKRKYFIEGRVYAGHNRKVSSKKIARC